MRLGLLGLLLALTCACRGELVPLGGGDDDDDDIAGSPDAGEVVELAFKPRIQNDLDTLGCTVANCHGLANTPMFVTATPGDDTAWMANYDQVEPRTGSADSSLLIAKATGVGGHQAVLATSSAVLQRWRDWIDDGAAYE